MKYAMRIIYSCAANDPPSAVTRHAGWQ